jgi:3-hydroxyisobutyrate dehydrogenase-like beta-hydroxyacid dehydrogenase
VVDFKLLLDHPINIESVIFSNENAMKKFSDDGIPTKRSPLEVSESSDVIITMLPSSAHVS